MSNTIVCSLCGTSGTNKGSCPLNKDAKNPNPDKHKKAKKVQIGGAKGPNRKFKIDVTMETPKVLGVFDLDDYSVMAPTWRKNPKPFKSIDPSKCSSEVVKWYKYVINVKGGPYADVGYYYLNTIGNFDIKHIKGNVFEVSYTLLDYGVDPTTGKAEPDSIKPWEVADPDFRYLFPLNCQGTKYHVYATVHGSKSKIPPRKVRSEHQLFRGPYNEPVEEWK